MNSLKKTATIIEQYVQNGYWERFESFIKGKKTPFLVINLEEIKTQYKKIKNTIFENSTVFYSVKANPANEVLKVLKDLDSNFDVASIYELEKVLKLGVKPNKISYGNTIKKEIDIKKAFSKGIRFFTCDSIEELNKISNGAPGSKIFFRLYTKCKGSDWPLSKKFGTSPKRIYQLILGCKQKNLIAYGLSFHVGSQQNKINQWKKSILSCYRLFNALRKKNINLKAINLGGGFPSEYLEVNKPIEKYLKNIKFYLHKNFGNDLPEIFIEPGRAIVGNTGIIISEIILKTQKNKKKNWLYLDVGLFNGLIETLNESIKYPIWTSKTSNSYQKYTLAGPTCDSMDILYEKHLYKLPKNLKIGDFIYILSSGAYTDSYSSINFNGLPPLKSYYI